MSVPIPLHMMTSYSIVLNRKTFPNYMSVNGAAAIIGAANITKVLTSSSPTKVWSPDKVANHATINNPLLMSLWAFRMVPFCLSTPKSGWRNTPPASPAMMHPMRTARPAANYLHHYIVFSGKSIGWKTHFPMEKRFENFVPRFD